MQKALKGKRKGGAAATIDSSGDAKPVPKRRLKTKTTPTAGPPPAPAPAPPPQPHLVEDPIERYLKQDGDQATIEKRLHAKVQKGEMKRQMALHGDKQRATAAAYEAWVVALKRFRELKKQQ